MLPIMSVICLIIKGDATKSTNPTQSAAGQPLHLDHFECRITGVLTCTRHNNTESQASVHLTTAVISTANFSERFPNHIIIMDRCRMSTWLLLLFVIIIRHNIPSRLVLAQYSDQPQFIITSKSRFFGNVTLDRSAVQILWLNLSKWQSHITSVNYITIFLLLPRNSRIFLVYWRRRTVTTDPEYQLNCLWGVCTSFIRPSSIEEE